MSAERLTARYRRSSPAALIAALVIAMLAAQAVTLRHELDPTPHAPDQPCEIHLASSVLGGATIGSFDLPPIVSPAAGIVPAHSAPLLPVPYPSCQARAPPFAA